MEYYSTDYNSLPEVSTLKMTKKSSIPIVNACFKVKVKSYLYPLRMMFIMNSYTT